MKITELTNAPPWLLTAHTAHADVDMGKGQVIWHSGVWHDGEWVDGVWENGDWFDGTWLGGCWYKGNHWAGQWLDGEWHGGTWQDGEWLGGIWHRGTWRGKEEDTPSPRPNTAKGWHSPTEVYDSLYTA